MNNNEDKFSGLVRIDKQKEVTDDMLDMKDGVTNTTDLPIDDDELAFSRSTGIGSNKEAPLNPLYDVTLPPSLNTWRPIKRKPIKTEGMVNLNKTREIDRRRRNLGSIYGFGDFSWYAADSATVKRLIESRNTSKPLWAVWGLVYLRDSGACRICSDQYGKSGQVVLLLPHNCGGQWHETNCITICERCHTCWNHYKNFFNSGDRDLDFKQLQLYVLGRRNRCYKNVRGLSERGYEIMKKLTDKKYDIKRKRERLEMMPVVEKTLQEILREGYDEEGNLLPKDDDEDFNDL